jgi:hypothetical protein
MSVNIKGEGAARDWSSAFNVFFIMNGTFRLHLIGKNAIGPRIIRKKKKKEEAKYKIKN